MTGSEAAYLRQQISSEGEAAQRGVSGFASVASHCAITARMERTWQHFQALHAAGREHEAQVLLVSDHFYETDEEAACHEHH
jgi:hypothetical protein